MRPDKKIFVIATLCVAVIFCQSFIQRHDDDDDKPTNLKILPKNISHKDLINTMKVYSMALGVRCNFCHVSEKIEGQDKPKFDFASDNKPEKTTARHMMMMMQGINENYIAKMTGGDHTLEQVTCVTCHMGRKINTHTRTVPMCHTSKSVAHLVKRVPPTLYSPTLIKVTADKKTNSQFDTIYFSIPPIENSSLHILS